ncbi:MAG: proteasome accessory factor PafA2 family protein [Canidatus Methanoxibalbensis ujae]|nr:proteasome accessory factor PafA2 family protein [Candidatus Methanoxibalbensis ujae]
MSAISSCGTLRKIRGVEQEYPVSATASFNPNILVNAAIQGLRRRNYSRIVFWDISTEISQEQHEHRITNSYGENGCRIYNDMGHLEISTPSYNDPFDAIAYDKASEIYAFIASKSAGLALKNRVFIHKNNVANFFVSIAGGVTGLSGIGGAAVKEERRVRTNTYATHGNLLTERRACKDWRRVERALIPWVISRIIFTGAGDVISGDVMGKTGIKFVISPRAMFVMRKSSLSTTSARGILNTRDQPHASFKYWRLHDIHFEALRSEYAIFMRDITNALVIRAFELGYLDDAPEIEDPVGTFKRISADTQDCDWRINLKNGEKTDAVGILWFYLSKIEEMLTSSETAGAEMNEDEDREEQKWESIGLKAFEEMLDLFSERRVEEFVDGIDWVTKLALLVNYKPRKISEGIHICNQFALLDESVLFYVNDGKERMESKCLFSPKESLSFARKKLHEVAWHRLFDRVRYALRNAPEDTRDFFRAEMLKHFSAHVRGVSWSTLILENAKIILDEPFMLNRREIGDISEYELSEILSEAKRLYPDKLIL